MAAGGAGAAGRGAAGGLQAGTWTARS